MHPDHVAPSPTLGDMLGPYELPDLEKSEDAFVFRKDRIAKCLFQGRSPRGRVPLAKLSVPAEVTPGILYE